MYSDNCKCHFLRKSCAALLLTIFLMSCGPQQSQNANYTNEIKAWQAERTRSLLAEDGWLNLVGLFELRPGTNTFGAGTDNDIVFKDVEAPSRIGYFEVGEHVSLHIVPDVLVTANGDTVHDMLVLTDADSAATIFAFGSLRWLVIQRGDRRYLRLRDFESEATKQFAGNSYFPIDPKWRLQAQLIPFELEKKLPVPNVLGEIVDWNTPGQLAFEIDGKMFRLTALGEMTDDELFVIFSDATNGRETYSAGRFMYVRTPGDDKVTMIDFNKAYNPPCVYTAYATCPLPPAENSLAVRIEAGEKNFGGNHEISPNH